MTSSIMDGNPVPMARTSSIRRISDTLVWSLSAAALLAIVLPAVWIVVDVVDAILPGWRWAVLTEVGSGLGGGLKNEIVGTLVITAGVVLTAGVVGILSGLYLSEYGEDRSSSLLRTASEVLAGIPSVVLGYVGYVALVVYFHWGYSLGAGVLVLAAMVVPYIAKATEVSLRQVPNSYREGGSALGMRNSQILRRLVLKSAAPGIATGLVIATAISIGETAPLLYTAGYSQSLPKLALTNHPVGYLTYAVWTFYNQPSQSAHQLALDAAAILIVATLALIIASRLIVALTQRHSEFK